MLKNGPVVMILLHFLVFHLFLGVTGTTPGKEREEVHVLDRRAFGLYYINIMIGSKNHSR